MPLSPRMSIEIGRKPTSSASKAPRVDPAVLIGGVAGLGLAAWLLSRYGVVQILEVLARIGWLGMLAIMLIHMPQMLCSAQGRQAIARAAHLKSGARKNQQ